MKWTSARRQKNVAVIDTKTEAHLFSSSVLLNCQPLCHSQNEDEKDEEREELEVLPTDNLLVIGKTEDEVSQLEAYLYSNSSNNSQNSESNERTFYVHHDLMLPSFPLCLEWLDYTPASFEGAADQNQSREGGEIGSFIAVGTMDPEIEIWDMDTVEGLFPSTILGRKDLTKGLNAMSGTGKKSEY